MTEAAVAEAAVAEAAVAAAAVAAATSIVSYLELTALAVLAERSPSRSALPPSSCVRAGVIPRPKDATSATPPAENMVMPSVSCEKIDRATSTGSLTAFFRWHAISENCMRFAGRLSNASQTVCAARNGDMALSAA